MLGLVMTNNPHIQR